MAANHNLQDQHTGNEELDNILQLSRHGLLDADQWQVVFDNRELFDQISNTRIPPNTPGIFRADSRHHFDLNNWGITSEKRKISGIAPDGMPFKFDIRFGESEEVFEDDDGDMFVFRRWVVRDKLRYDDVTFVHYAYVHL